VPLIDLLNEAVIITDPNRRNDILRKYVVAGATDCYEAIIAVADLLPNFGAQHVSSRSKPVTGSRWMTGREWRV
jgi:hypothetical protein